MGGENLRRSNISLMGKSHHSHRLATSLAAVAIFFVFVIGSLQIVSAQTRIITVGGDLNFGSIPLGASTQRTVIIGNAGDSTLTVSNLIYTPTQAHGQIAFQGNFSGPLPPGVSVFVPITFTPTPLNRGTNDLSFQGDLSINSDATSGTNFISISGVGTYPPVKPNVHLNFGNVQMGGARAMTLILTNMGTVTVTVSNITFPSSFTSSPGYGGGGGFGGGGGGAPRGGNSTPSPRSSFISRPVAIIAPHSATTNYLVFAPSSVGRSDPSDVVTISSDAREPILALVTPKGNVTNSDLGLNVFSVSGTGTYPSGNYVGLFAPTNNPEFESSGYFSARSTGSGSLRATLTVAGKPYPFTAQTSSSGAVTATITRKHLPALNISLQFGLFRGWTGTISDGTWTAQLLALQAPLHSRNSMPAVPSGDYAFTIAGSTNASVAPTASGTGNLNLRSLYANRITGTLADGTRFSQNTTLGYSMIPLYAPLYGNRGAVLGWIFLYFPSPPIEVTVPIIEVPRQTNSPVWPVFPPPTLEPITSVEQINPTAEMLPPTNSPFETLSEGPATTQFQIVGTLNWFKPARIDSHYPNGFSFQTTVNGAGP
jgi:hypothetical protein